MPHPESVERFRELLRIPTISIEHADDGRAEQLALFRAALERLYPRVHAELERELVAEHTLLFRWRGRSSEQPTVLMAHQDVVPADDGGWTHPPFAAELVEVDGEQRIWARGAIDDKGMLVALLEAVEQALAEGVVPQHDIWLLLGHDEERFGTGAQSVARLFEQRGVKPAFVLDEGGAIVTGVLPGVDAPLAMIGVTEKGIANFELRVEQQGGHASTPPATTAVDRLAGAIARLRRRPAPAEVPEPVIRMLEVVAPHAAGPRGRLFARARSLRGLLARVFVRLGPETAALVRTTRAVTELRGSAAPNVLAERATATVNVRVAVGSSVEAERQRIVRAIDDPKVRVTTVEASEPSPVSPTSGAIWERLGRAITGVHPAVVPTPYVMLGASDSRHLAHLSPAVYRFSPFAISAAQRAALHAIDENVSVATWLDGIRVFRRLIDEL
ncbi:M20 family peptidase [Schumannella luteola]|uniref:Carboxypeptidase PM20D1 n=1 Tax=Schumannella luteola TaxID=472059 RepID=A0A852YR50_9MICO|nr:M20/M25/M40 family metallo-hydrolase [Schumannella luteola]NYG99725.1 carboxypeptidase PM20D1 [Schumannella luteola]TPX06505.1 M20/M25/M40 family metallo-hydrolase [Schumannella luteola]